MSDGEADDESALVAQLDRELLALRSLRDEDLRSVKHGGGGGDGDDDSATEESDGEEFAELLRYKPRCSFRPMSARRKVDETPSSARRPDSAAAGDAPFHSASAAVVAAHSSAAAAATLDDTQFTIDGVLVNSPTSARRPGTSSGSSSRSRPHTASRLRGKRDHEEKTLSPDPASGPMFTLAEQVDHDGTEAFINAYQTDLAELHGLISSAPAPSDAQRALLDQGVDIAAWSRARREQLVDQAHEAHARFEEDQAARERKQQLEASQHLAIVNAPRPDVNGVLPEDSGETNGAAGSLLPALASSISPPPPIPPPTPTPSLGLPSTTSLSASLSVRASPDKFLARSLARDAAFAAFAADEAATVARKAAVVEATKRQEQEQARVEEETRKEELATWTRNEEKRLREIKAAKAQQAVLLAQREQATKSTASLLRERAAMRLEDDLVHRRMERTRAIAEQLLRAVALEARTREHAALAAEDERSTIIFKRVQAVAREQRRLADERAASEAAERARLEAVRLQALQAKQAAEANQAAEYARIKKEEARAAAERQAAEEARQAKLEAERLQYELEALRMKEAALRAKVEAERLAEEARAAEAARLAAIAAEAERVKQEAIARELARRAEEEEERRAYFERMRKEKEAAAQAEAERVARELAEAEALARKQAAEQRAREKLHKVQSRAARRIQRLWRGVHVRLTNPLVARLRAWREARWRARTGAAITIQALMRGWLLRRKLRRIRAHAARGLVDEDDPEDFDYQGLDPAFYTIEAIPDFDIDLPDEARDMLANHARDANRHAHKQQTHHQPQLQQQPASHSRDRDRERDRDRSSSSSSSAATAAQHGRVHSAGSSQLSSSGRGGLVSSQHSVAPAQADPRRAVNNFFGNTNASPPAAAASRPYMPPAEPTKFPRLSTPNSQRNGSSPSPPPPHLQRISTAQSDASDVSHRSADHSSRPEGVAPSGGSKAAKLAELSAAWGVSDPRTLEAMLRKKNKMAKLHSKKTANMSADERLEKFQRAGGPSSGSGWMAQPAPRR